jgi:carboxyl-terminal processing protease
VQTVESYVIFRLNFYIMIERIISRSLLLLLGCSLVFPVFADVKSASLTPAELTATTNSDKSLAPYHVSPGPADGKIAFVTAKLLQQTHFSKQAFDAGVSSKFLDHYLEALDPQHLHFLQSDLAEFERYRAKLGDLTVNQRGTADTRPAYEIFDRFIQRFQERVAYADELLKNEKFTFDTDEKITINRKDQPYPKDLNEAKQLWKQRLRFEYLQEKLGKRDAQKKKKKSGTKDEGKKNEAKPRTEAEEIVDTLTHTYHRSVHSFTNWNNEDVLQVYLDTLAHVYDPHSDYMGPSHLDSFSISMNLSLTGIGAELISPDGYCTINRILEGGPAARSKKIKEKDRIVAVAQGDKPPVDVVDMNLNKVVQMIRGPKGTEVRLTIIPAGEPNSATNTITLVRDEIKLEDQAAKAKVIDVPAGNGQTNRLGVINLPSFYGSVDLGGSRHMELASEGTHGGRSTTADVARLLKKLKAEHINGVILDLRANGGGFLEEAVNLTGLFIKNGPVVQVRDWKGDLQEEDDPDASVLYDGPLIVLTSRFSASASEILAGALQDYGRALIVGDSSTHGKGTVQSVNELRNFITPPGMPPTNDYGAVKLTIKKFYRASGASTQLKGVMPDIILPSVASESKDIGEAALENPMPWDTIPGAKYDKLDMVEPYLPELRKQSAQRIAADKDFAYLREDIELFKKQQNDKTLSLNERKRLQEKEEAEAREKAREKERRGRTPSSEIVYDLTLKQLEKPGLPPPVQKTNSVSALDINAPSVPTNAAAIAAAAGLDDNRDTEADEDKNKVPPPDVSLVEAEHILVDYLFALKQGVLTANHQHKPVE